MIPFGHYELYAMNLYRAGVLDELGHVIPE
jgi:hypothetical protein